MADRPDDPQPVALLTLHPAVPAIMVVQPGTIEDGIERANPDLSAVELSYALLVTLIAAAIFRLLFVGVYAWLAAKVGAGRRWARIALNVTLVVAAAASLVSFTTSPLFWLVIPVTDLLQLALIGLLWLAPDARSYFSRDQSA